MPSVERHDDYRRQSRWTDPGPHGERLNGLPGDLAGLCRVVQGLVVHYFADEVVQGYKVPPDRLGEADTRAVAAMLARLVELDGRPLAEARPPERRLVGCCRDFAVLLCAMARHRGIPARLRVGFATYFVPGAHEDHAVTEWWDAAAGRWRLVDPQLGPPQLAHYRIAFDPLDVPPDRFLVAGRAWQMCRRGAADPTTFGVSAPGAPRGWPFLTSRLLLDLAALGRQELLQWDSWGLDAAAAGALDEAARLSAGEVEPASLRALTADHPGLAVPPVIRSFSPASGPGQVTLPGSSVDGAGSAP
jgi:hypothetical protein